MSVGSSRWHSRLQILRRRGRLVFWSGLATLAIAEAFVLGLPSLYRSSATLLVQGGVSDAFVQSSVPDAINARLQTIKQEALSRGRLEELIRRFGLYGASPDKNVSEAMLARFQRDVRVDVTNDQSANGKSTAIAFSLSYVGNAPQTAADVANALASFYVAQNNQMRAEQASKATEYIGAQLAETKGRLDAQESKVSGYTAENMGALPQQVDANLAAVTRLDAQLRLNGEERLKLVERRQTLQNQIAEIDTRVPPADDASPAAQVTRKQKELADLRAQFPDTYPDVRMAKAELAQLQRLAANATATPAPGASERATATQALSETNTQIQALEKEDTSLRSQIDTYEKRVDTAPAHQPVIEGLVRDYQSTRDRYDALLKRYDDAQLAERAENGRDTEEFQVLDAAIPPTSSTGPAKTVLLGAGLVLALVVGLGAAATVEYLDTSFHTIEDLRDFTSVPVLVSIPDIVTHRGTAVRRLRMAALAGAQLLILAVLAAGAFRLAHASEPIVRVLSRVS